MGHVFSRLFFSPPPPPPSPELKKPWRKVTWRENTAMLRGLEDFQPSSESLRILLYGPTGAGKSCFINSVQRILLNRNFIGAQEQTAQDGTSYTLEIKTHKLKKRRGGHYPFAFVDIMGLEEGNSGGIIPEDIFKVLEGHISNGYKFNPLCRISKRDPKYQNPTLCDKVHCLVGIVPADAISRMSNKVIDKMKMVQERAKDLKIPKVIVLTKVDQACEMVNQDLRTVYHSRKIKEKVEQCSNTLGISMNAIYPVQNYYSEITQDENIDTIILMVLRDIVNFANDHVEDLDKTDEI